MSRDKVLVCKDCGGEFVFSSGEQKFYSERELDDPKRCQDCRRIKRERSRN